jgi:hypothetical protein
VIDAGHGTKEDHAILGTQLRRRFATASFPPTAAGRRPRSSAALGTTMPPGKACRHRVSAKIKPKLTLMFLGCAELIMHFIMTAFAFCFLSAVLLGLL